MKKLLLILLSTTTLATTAQNLAAYYPLNGNANDQSGNNKNGVITNVIATNDRNNNTSAAMNYNGTTSKIEVADTSGFNNGNGSISVAAWFKNESLSGINPILTTGMQGFASGIYLCSNYLYANGKIVFALASSTTGYPAGVPGTIFIQSSLSTYNDNQWHHVVVVVDKTLNIATMYIDGIKANIQKYTGLGATGGTIQNNNTELNITGLTNNSRPSQAYVGVGVASGANQFWKGDLDEIYYFKRALTVTEIQDLYNGVSVNVNNLDKKHEPITIYPNPANQSIKILGVDFNDEVYVKIISIDGKIMKDEMINQPIINVSDLNFGMYFIELTDSKGKTGVTKFIKN
jgi:hypothetical protein